MQLRDGLNFQLKDLCLKLQRSYKMMLKLYLQELDTKSNSQETIKNGKLEHFLNVHKN